MTSNNATRKREIKIQLERTLLEEGEMHHSLYEHELEEHIDYWYASLKEDNDDYAFVVTENNSHTAMVLIMADKTLYINEKGREKLQQLWATAYERNIKRLIPDWADQLADSELPFQGVKAAKR